MSNNASYQSSSKGATRVVRGGVLWLMASPLVRCLSLLALIAANLPHLAAGLLMLGDFHGEHKLQCHFDADRVEITLHHQFDELAAASMMGGHRHTLIENLLVGRCVAGDQSDHYFGFARQRVLTEEDDSRFQELAAMVGFEPLGETLVFFNPLFFESMTLDPPRDLEGGLSPPQVMRRGVMMRV